MNRSTRPWPLLFFHLFACSADATKAPSDLHTEDAPEIPRARGQQGEGPMLGGAPLEPTPSDSSEPLGGAPAPAPASAPLVLQGKATTTSSFGFGGDPYACSWRITMKSVVLDVKADATTGDVSSATLRARACEEVLPPCGATPYPEHEHVYTLKTVSAAASKSPLVKRLELAPAAANLPLALATIELDLSKTPVSASIRVHRTDQPSPLDWTVLAKLPLESK